MIWKSIFRGLISCITLFIFHHSGQAQVEFSGEAIAEGFVSEEALPFWFYSNRRGRINQETSIATWAHIKGIYELTGNAEIEVGARVLYQDAARYDNLDIDEAYIQFKNSWLRISAGIKQHDELYAGLSGTNGNMIWSLNAKPLPGIELNTIHPIYFLFDKHLGFSGTWGEFWMNFDTDRFVKNVRVHKKSLFLDYRSQDDLKIKVGIEHFAQWAGESPEARIGKQPNGFKDYLKIISGQGGSDGSYIGEQTNALGNHLGTYEFRISKEIKGIYYELMLSHIFDDGSGMLYYNRPDGKYGLYMDLSNFSIQEKPWVQKFLYEFYYTKDQSHERSPLIHKWDNYFNNGLYQSGWTYKGEVIGLPFFTINQYGNDKKPSIGNNRVIVHHFGIKGNIIRKYPYKVLLSYRNNNGHVRNLNETEGEEFREDDPRVRFTMPHEIISTLLDVQLLNSFVQLNLELGGDFSSEENILGAGVRLSKQF